jgi:hypothetical protein
MQLTAPVCRLGSTRLTSLYSYTGPPLIGHNTSPFYWKVLAIRFTYCDKQHDRETYYAITNIKKRYYNNVISISNTDNNNNNSNKHLYVPCHLHSVSVTSPTTFGVQYTLQNSLCGRSSDVAGGFCAGGGWGGSNQNVLPQQKLRTIKITTIYRFSFYLTQ